MTSIRVQQVAPAFSLRGTHGGEFSLAKALQQGPVVASFFKISCPTCQYALPFLERLHRAYPAGRVSFWGISQDDASDTMDFCKEFQISFPALVDAPDYPVSNQYGLLNVPTTFLIGQNGNVRLVSIGFVKADLERLTAELATQLGVPAAAPFRPGEDIPDFKAG